MVVIGPPHISAGPSFISENQPPGTRVGVLYLDNYVDPVPEVSPYPDAELVDDPESDDDSAFAVVQGSLFATKSLDFETKHSYFIRVSIDGTEWGLTIYIVDVGEPPTDIVAAGAVMRPYPASGWVAATLSATDADTNESFAYSLASGLGDTDNAAFRIAGNQVLLDSLRQPTKQTYSVRIRATDRWGLSTEKVVAINVDETAPPLPMSMAGELDTTFGRGGIVTRAMPRGEVDGVYTLWQPDGKVLVAGSRPGPSGDVFVRRLNADGTKDNSFSPASSFKHRMGETGRDLLDGIMLQADGGIVLVRAYHPLSGGLSLALQRLLPNGKFDTSFGARGTLDLGMSGSVRWDGSTWGGDDLLAIQPDGRILVEGVRNGEAQVVRLDADGTLDTTFGAGGYATLAGSAFPTGLRLAPDGDIYALAASYTATSTFLTRLNSDGLVDSDFDDDGTITIELTSLYGGSYRETSGRELAVGSDGRIYVGGGLYGETGNARGFVAAFTPDGNPDTAFAGSGALSAQGTVPGDSRSYYLGSVNTLLLQDDGKLLVQSFGGQGSRLWLQRYSPDGVLDATFGTGGTTVVEDQDIHSAADMSVQGDGRILIASVSAGRSSTKLSLLRRWANTSWGTGGADAILGSDDHILRIIGTSAQDAIRLSRSGKALDVMLNGYTWRFVASQVHGITLDAMEGDDSVLVSRGVVAGEIRGGDGNDTIFAENALNTVYGGAGDDRLQVNQDANTVHADAGRDTVILGKRASTVYASGNGTSISCGSGRAWIYTRNGAADTIRTGTGRIFAQIDDLDTILGSQSLVTTIPTA